MYYIKPAKGFLTSLFSNSRKNPVLGIIRPHQGIDISSDADNTIIAAANGVVRVADNSQKTGFGKYIVITHPNGQETVYAHLSSISVRAGQEVKQGQKIGIKGSTGNSTGIHLHFEVCKSRFTNSFSNKLDPLLLFTDPVTKEIQKMLNKLGYGNLKEDGIYGDATISAVAKYQKNNKLNADGVAGRTTYGHIEKSFNSLKNISHSPTTSPTQKGDDEELKFTSATLKKEFETFISSKAQREIVVKYAVEQGYSQKWINDVLQGKAEDGDLIMLGIGALIKASK